MNRLVRVIPLLTAVLFSMLFNSGCNQENKKRLFLGEVYTNLDQIKSAAYYSTRESWAPGDTTPLLSFRVFCKEIFNPADTAIGSSYAVMSAEDTTNMSFCYDGNMRAVVYQEEKYIVVDSFKVRPLPFRPIAPPFFNYAKSIIRYAMETDDTILTDITDYGDSLLLKLVINESENVEFFGKPFHMDRDPNDHGETTSLYEIWIDKSNKLPFRVRREMSYDISVEICRKADFNTLKLKDFRATDYFNPEFTVVPYGRGIKRSFMKDLTGSPAPGWSLKDAEDRKVSLTDFKSKVLIVQFSSITCGPCKSSIPFLKSLASEYDKKDLDIVSLVTWASSTKALDVYQSRNDFDYTFLLSTPEVSRSYLIKSVPVFFILDENRIIRKVIKGYSEGETDTEIRKAIEELK